MIADPKKKKKERKGDWGKCHGLCWIGAQGKTKSVTLSSKYLHGLES